MPRFIKKVSKQAGLIPGTLIHIGEKKAEKAKITVIDYNQTLFQEKELKTVEESFPFKDSSTVTWINIDGLHDLEIIEKIGQHFEIHSLALEDILNTDQRPKLEDFESYIFVVFKMLYRNQTDNGVIVEQVSLILGKNYVISFQEREGDVFNAVRERIRNAKGRVRKAGADYLAYSLMDAVIDNYFLIIETMGEKIEGSEERLVINPTPEVLQSIHNLKRETIFLRKSVWPLREVISALERGESSLVQKTTRVFLRDLYDHTIQVLDTVETFRDLVASMLDIYLSSLSNRMNEVMKVLTIIATIFIPLTFIAGIYGMNFKYMPELGWRWGYFGALGIMVLVALLMMSYFKRKKWL